MHGGNRLTAVLAAALCTALAGCNTGFIKRDAPIVAQAPIEVPSVAAPPRVAAPASPAPLHGKTAGAERAPETQAPVGDTWSTVRARFRFTGLDNAEISREREWYRRHPRYLHNVATRARPYLQFITQELQQRDLPGELALLPILESGFRTDVTSPYGAAGLWQFMGGTGTKFGLDIDPWYDGRMDIVRSTGAALNYLAALSDRFDGDWLMAIAAYNAGWGNLEKAIATQRRLGRRTDLWSLPLPQETRRLVARLIALANIFETPGEYGLHLEALPDRPYFESVKLQVPTDLNRFREALGAPSAEFDQLNAAWRRGYTRAAGATLHVPVEFLDNARTLAANGTARAEPSFEVAASRDAPEHVGDRLRVHRVRKGDSLSSIAARHRVDVRALSTANGIPLHATLRIGQSLRIPGAQAVAATRSHAGGRADTLRYRVRSGDSLWTISRQFKVTVKQLVAWNGLNHKQHLQPGQELLIRLPS